MKNSLTRRILAVVLCAALAITYLPISALADSVDTALSMTEGDVIADFAAADAACTSSDPSIAWVDENGALNAMKPGTVTINDGEKDYTVTVSDYDDGSEVVGNLKLLARFNDSMQFYDGHVYLLFTSYQDGVTITVPDLYASYKISEYYYSDIREDISYGSNHTGNDVDSYFTFTTDENSVTLNRGEIVTIGMYRDFDLSVPAAALGSIKNSSLWADLKTAGKATVVENLFKLLDNGSISDEDALAKLKAIFEDEGLDYNKLLDGVVDGGVCFNRELYNQKLEWDQYENVTYEMDITRNQLNMMTMYLGGNLGNFSILKNSCATVALRAWNAAVGMRNGEETSYYLTSASDGIFRYIDAPKGVRDNMLKRLPGCYLNNAEGVAEPDAGYQDDTGWVYVSAPEKVEPVNYVYLDDSLKIADYRTPLTPLVNAAKAGQDVSYAKDAQEIGVTVAQADGVISGIDFTINDKTVTLNGENMPEGGVWLSAAVDSLAEGESYYVTDADDNALASEYDPEEGTIDFCIESLPQSYQIVTSSEGAQNILRVVRENAQDVDIDTEVYYYKDSSKVVIENSAALESGTKVYVKTDLTPNDSEHMIDSIVLDMELIFDEEHYDAQEGAYFGVMPEHYSELLINYVEAEIRAVGSNQLQLFVGDTLNVDDYAHLHLDDDEGYILDSLKWIVVDDENGALSFDGDELKAVKEGTATIFACAKNNENIGVPYTVEIGSDRSDYVAVTFNGEVGEEYFLYAFNEDGNSKIVPYSGYLVKKGSTVSIYPHPSGSKSIFTAVCNGNALSLEEGYTGADSGSVTADTDLDFAVTLVDAEIKNMPKQINLASADETYQLEAYTAYKGVLGLVAPYDSRIYYDSSDPLVSVDENGLISVTGEIPEDGACAIVTAYAASSAAKVYAQTKVVLGNYQGDRVVGRLTISARPITKAQLIAHGAVTFTTYEDIDLPVSYYRYYKPNDKYNALLSDYEANPENYTSDPALYNDDELGLEDRESYFDVIEGGVGIEPQTVSLKSGESITMSNYGYDNARVEAILSALEGSTIASSAQTQVLIDQLTKYTQGDEIDENATFDSVVATLKQIITESRATGKNPADGRSEGGLDINREMYNQFRRPDSQLPNNYYTVEITADEFEMMKAYISDPENNYYSLMTKNCATGAVDIWNATLADKPELHVTGNYTGIAVEPESLYIELGLLGLKKDLDGDGGKDFYPRSVAHLMSYSDLKDAIDALGEPELTDAYKAELDKLRDAYDDLSDSEKALVDNIQKLIDAQFAYDDLKNGPNRERFDDYKADKIADADALAKEGDSLIDKMLISLAKAAIENTEYNPELTLEENEAVVDAILDTLADALELQRLIEHPILGDVDYSGDVTIIDATYIQRDLALAEMPFILNDSLADVDGDKYVSVIDVSVLQRWIADPDPESPIGKPIR